MRRDLNQRVGDRAAGGQRQHPRPEDAFDDVQLERVETLRAADAHDGGGDGVRGGDGHPKMRRGEQHGGAGGFRRETVDRMEPHHFVAERLDDAPAAGGGAGAHGQRAKNRDPRGDELCFGVERGRLIAELQPRRQVRDDPGHRRQVAGGRAFGRLQPGQASRAAEANNPGLGGDHQRERDDAHGFLRVVGAVGKAHVAGAEQLQFAKGAVDGDGPPVAQ